MRAVDNAGNVVARRPRSTVRSATVRFVVWSLAALVVLTLGTIVVSKRVAHQEALREARMRGVGIATGIAAPLVNQALRVGDPEAVDRLDDVLSNRMRDGSVSHIKIWDASGQVMWSDEAALVSRRFALPDEIRTLFRTDTVLATFHSPHREDNELETGEGPFYEVYVGLQDADGLPMVFETYISPERLGEDTTAVLRELLPLGLGALFLFQLAILPLALSLARRVQRHEAERSGILRRALLSSEHERRRIAQEMHDVVVQKLAAVGYALPAVADGIADGPEADEARTTLNRAGSLLGEGMSSLRAVLADIYPPELRDVGGLREALQELADGAAQESVAVDMDLGPDLSMPMDTARLVYRIVREGLRNVLRHAQAERAWVSVHTRGEDVDVRVADDGLGVPGGTNPEPGHLGIRLLADSVQDAGGDLALRPRDDGGAVLEARFPAALV